jgi:hypothetical protein
MRIIQLASQAAVALHIRRHTAPVGPLGRAFEGDGDVVECEGDNP